MEPTTPYQFFAVKGSKKLSDALGISEARATELQLSLWQAMQNEGHTTGNVVGYDVGLVAASISSLAANSQELAFLSYTLGQATLRLAMQHVSEQLKAQDNLS